MGGNSKKYVRLTSKSTKNVNYTDVVKKDFIIDSSSINICFLIFSMNEFLIEHQLNHEELLIILYLFELGLFPTYIDINRGPKYSLNSFIKKGLVEVEGNIENKKNLHRLSDIGLELVKNVFYKLEKYNDFIGFNREVLMDLDSRSTDILNKYFK